MDFSDEVRRQFEFLAHYGLVESEHSSTHVRYEGPRVAVTIYHGRQSYELGGEFETPEGTFGLTDIIRTTDPESADKYRKFCATTAKGLREGITQLRALFKRYGHTALRGEAQFFGRVTELRDRAARAYAGEIRAGQIRPRAGEAFRRRDYGTAAELYGQIEAQLSPTEQKKLAYARVHAPQQKHRDQKD